MNNKKTTGAGLAALGAVSGVFCVDTIARDRSVSVLFGGYSYTAPLSTHETGMIFFTLFSVCILAIGLLLFFSKKESPAPKSRREPEEEPLYPLDPPPKFSKLEMKIEEYGVGSCVAGVGFGLCSLALSFYHFQLWEDSFCSTQVFYTTARGTLYVGACLVLVSAVVWICKVLTVREAQRSR